MLDFDGILMPIISSKNLRNYHRKRDLSFQTSLLRYRIRSSFDDNRFYSKLFFISKLLIFKVLGEKKLDKIVATYSKFHDVEA